MKETKLFLLALFGIVPWMLFGKPVVLVDDAVLDSKQVFEWAEKVIYYSEGLYQGLKGHDAWKRFVEDIVLDFKAGCIAMGELKARNINTVQAENFTQFSQRAIYDNYPRALLGLEYNLQTAIESLAKADFGGNVTIDKSIKQQILNRYANRHAIKEMGEEELLASYGDVSTGVLVKRDDYEADKVELNEKDGKFLKFMYFVHRHTVRYYVIALRWYVSKVDQLALESSINGEKRKVEWIKTLGYFIVPYTAMFALLFTINRMFRHRLKVKRVFRACNIIYIASIILYYFGMSPISLFIVVVVLPVLFFCFKFKIEHDPEWALRRLYTRSSTGSKAPKGYAYDSIGCLCKISKGDLVFDMAYTPRNARRPAHEGRLYTEDPNETKQ